MYVAIGARQAVGAERAKAVNALSLARLSACGHFAAKKPEVH